jgi:formylglycine-generating enzyme required for sulfatase activity
MHKHLFIVLSLPVVAGLALTACQPAPPAPAEEATPTEEPTPTPEPTAAPTKQPTEAPTSISEPTIEPAIAELALAGVASNGEWTPYIQDFDGVEMALVPAGCFMMGSTEEEVDYAVELCEEDLGEDECSRGQFTDEQPTHEVCFDEPFWIDVYEVTNAQYGSLGCERYSSDDDQPRNCVSWTDAAAHCEARGARLPTEAEWEYAARGSGGLVYPWGNEFIAENVVYGGNSGNRAWDVGSKPGGASWVGAYDLSGNIWEWVNDWYGSYSAGQQTNPQGPVSGDYRVLRGGSWGHLNPYNLRGAHRSGADPSVVDISIGFRCARSY